MVLQQGRPLLPAQQGRFLWETLAAGAMSKAPLQMLPHQHAMSRLWQSEGVPWTTVPSGVTGHQLQQRAPLSARGTLMMPAVLRRTAVRMMTQYLLWQRLHAGWEWLSWRSLNRPPMHRGRSRVLI